MDRLVNDISKPLKMSLDFAEALQIIARGRDDNDAALHGETSHILARAVLSGHGIRWETRTDA